MFQLFLIDPLEPKFGSCQSVADWHFCWVKTDSKCLRKWSASAN